MWQILTDNRIDPAPNRSNATWTEFLRSQAAVACSFFTVDTAFLRRHYVLFFISVETRQVFHAGTTTNPTDEWTTQATRNLFIAHSDSLEDARALVRDHIERHSENRPHRSLQQKPPTPANEPPEASQRTVPVPRTTRYDGFSRDAILGPRWRVRRFGRR